MNKIIYEMQMLERGHSNFDDLDYFVFAAGSDGRAYEVLSRLSSAAATEYIIFNFDERLSRKKSDDTIFDYQKISVPKLNPINCAIMDPSSSLPDIDRFGFKETDRIGIDISCFTKPYFYFLMKLLREKYQIETLSVFYTEPKSYFFPGGIFGAFHSSSGPLSVIEMPGFSGLENMRSRQKLIILLGFDGELSREIKEDVSPQDTIVVNGFPSYSPKFKDISLVTNERLIGDDDTQVRYARANNPFDVYNVLEDISRNSDNETVLNIAPLGTKPMALGACLFALHNPEVRIMYPLPEQYEEKYSDEFWNSWIYSLPLSI
ncbi:MAG: hypothetical protein ACKVRN_11485 [Pyrinomonadaceae bacterium]